MMCYWFIRIKLLISNCLLFYIILDITVKNNPKYGEILKVKYEDKIFRAKVLNTFGKTYTVFLMDIGKNINVSADEIFEISNELKNVFIHFSFANFLFNYLVSNHNSFL